MAGPGKHGDDVSKDDHESSQHGTREVPMSNSFETHLGYGTTVERDFQSQANTIAQKISGWVLAGNGAGLLICFNALADRTICNWDAVKPLALLFLLGIVCAFASVVFAGRVAELAAARMIKINAAMRLGAMYVGNVTTATERLQGADEDLRGKLTEVQQNAEVELNKDYGASGGPDPP
jgi:hypothetical protein